jgi:hypothetical protein
LNVKDRRKKMGRKNYFDLVIWVSEFGRL